MCCIKKRADKHKLEQTAVEKENDSTEESVNKFKLKHAVKEKVSQLRYKNSQQAFETVTKRPRKKKYDVKSVISEQPSEMEQTQRNPNDQPHIDVQKLESFSDYENREDEKKYMHQSAGVTGSSKKIVVPKRRAGNTTWQKK